MVSELGREINPAVYPLADSNLSFKMAGRYVTGTSILGSIFAVTMRIFLGKWSVLELEIEQGDTYLIINIFQAFINRGSSSI
ncbi:MAG: hypothetical protein P8X65_08155 [Syntrophobacterales bacterium]|jgi:hypothetical protein